MSIKRTVRYESICKSNTKTSVKRNRSGKRFKVLLERNLKTILYKSNTEYDLSGLWNKVKKRSDLVKSL